MEILYSIDGQESNLIFNKICLLMGQNASGKTKIISTIRDYINNCSKSIRINGNIVNKDDYNVLYFDEETDFSKEFKFTKSNIFRTIIYDDITNKINQDKILKEVNQRFNEIDNKINNFVEKEIKEDLRFDINIPDINKIIEKFTDIYFDEYLLSDDNISKSVKRKLIYQLLLFYIKANTDKDTFIIIDNFDIYLDSQNTINIINLINKYTEKYNNVYFIITTNKNVYKYINNNISIYKVKNNKLIDFNDFTIKEIIKNFIITFNNIESSIDIISDYDIEYYYKHYFIINKDKIGETLINDDIKIYSIENSPKSINPFIICNSIEEKKLLNIIKNYIDKNS